MRQKSKKKYSSLKSTKRQRVTMEEFLQPWQKWIIDDNNKVEQYDYYCNSIDLQTFAKYRRANSGAENTDRVVIIIQRDGNGAKFTTSLRHYAAFDSTKPLETFDSLREAVVESVRLLREIVNQDRYEQHTRVGAPPEKISMQANRIFSTECPAEAQNEPPVVDDIEAVLSSFTAPKSSEKDGANVADQSNKTTFYVVFGVILAMIATVIVIYASSAVIRRRKKTKSTATSPFVAKPV